MEDFEPMIKMAVNSAVHAQSLMAYCDYIAHIISGKLRSHDSEGLLQIVGRPKYDMSPDGKILSAKKTITVHDVFGKEYRITVEEVK